MIEQLKLLQATLTVPAVEYVPAIDDALQIIDQMLAASPQPQPTRAQSPAEAAIREALLCLPRYAKRDHIAQGAVYLRHVDAMTGEGLHRKSDIAAELAQRDIWIAELLSELDALRAATQLCETHKPRGGTRSVCLVCAGEQLSAALSRIDYLCGAPNEMGVSGYDVLCDEQAVVANAQALRARCEAGEALLRGIVSSFAKDGDIPLASIDAHLKGAGRE